MRIWGVEQISKRRFYDLGGFANSRLFRKAAPSGAYGHFKDNR